MNNLEDDWDATLGNLKLNDSFLLADSADGVQFTVVTNGNRSKGGHKPQQGGGHHSEGSRTDERSGSWPSLEEGGASVDEEDELKEMKGNSLLNGGAKSFDSHRPKSGPNPDESSLPTGPLFSDQDQVR